MSRRAFTLPLRLAPSATPKSQPWVCRRCLATQAEAATTSASNTTPPVSDDMFQQTVPQASPSPDSQQKSAYDPSLPAAQRTDPATGRPYRLSPTDFLLKKGLPHPIPTQLLQHSSSELLNPHEQEARARTVGHREIVGVVVSAGKMNKTVKVRVAGQRWEKKIGKYFPDPTNYLVHDPNNSLVPGDVVSLHRLRVSTAVHHVIGHIVTPFGKPVEQRPHIPTPDERLAAYKGERFAKLKRRTLRRKAALGDAEAIQELRAMGLDPGQGVQAGKGEKANLRPGVGKGALRGEKGQKLPKGVLPGGKQEVGKIDARVKHNKEKAEKLDGKAKDNLAEAREKSRKLEAKGVGADPLSGASIREDV